MSWAQTIVLAVTILAAMPGRLIYGNRRRGDLRENINARFAGVHAGFAEMKAQMNAPRGEVKTRFNQILAGLFEIRSMPNALMRERDER